MSSRGGTVEGASPEASPHVAPVRWIEVPPGVANQERAGGPAPAAEHLVRAKPGLGILAVGIDHESGKGTKVIDCPFPEIAQHLAATEEAVAVGQGIRVN